MLEEKRERREKREERREKEKERKREDSEYTHGISGWERYWCVAQQIKTTDFLSFLLGVVILLTGPFPRPRFVPDKKAFDCMFFAICFAPSPAINPLGFSFSTLTAGATVVRNDMSRALSLCVLYRVFFGSL